MWHICGVNTEVGDRGYSPQPVSPNMIPLNKQKKNIIIPGCYENKLSPTRSVFIFPGTLVRTAEDVGV
jgi:hypothetical protein